MHRHGGVVATREMMRVLAQGTSVALTADVPKIARKCGIGVVTLAQLTGRPILPIAVATGWRIDLKSWDRASIPLPFGRCAMVMGTPLSVDRRASAQELERIRAGLEAELDAINARAFELVGSQDPGRALNRTVAA